MYKIYQFLTRQDKALTPVLSLPTLADIVNGCFSQYLNNQFQSSQGLEVADHRLLIQPSHETALFQASKYLPDAKAFDAFLIEPFLHTERKQEQNENEWLEECKKTLRSKLENQSLKGLCSGILLRHIFGESADNGPDNMLLTEQGIVNIDLTGFRYEREKAFNTSLGWKETLTTTNESTLLERLFDSSVFKSRYIDNSQKIEDNLKATIHQAIVEVLSEKVQPLVAEEIDQLRSWLAGLDLAYINGNLKQTIHEICQSLDEGFNVIPDEQLAVFIDYIQKFITRAIEVASSFIREQEQSPLRDFSMFKAKEQEPDNGLEMTSRLDCN